MERPIPGVSVRSVMNHLAHALVSGDDADRIVGGFLGDFVHGPVDPGLPMGVRQGLMLHRAVDVYTDGHPIVAEARSHFDPPYRRYAGIIVDIWFDHLLARDFAAWSPVPLASFSSNLRTTLQHANHLLPPALQRFLRYMQINDLPTRYRDEQQIQRVLEGVGARLLRVNPLASSFGEIDRLRVPLQRAFDGFFPLLVGFAADKRNDTGHRA